MLFKNLLRNSCLRSKCIKRLQGTKVKFLLEFQNNGGQAEDRVDELSKELLQARHRVQATEEEKRGKEEEATMVQISSTVLTEYSLAG